MEGVQSARKPVVNSVLSEAMVIAAVKQLEVVYLSRTGIARGYAPDFDALEVCSLDLVGTDGQPMW